MLIFKMSNSTFIKATEGELSLDDCDALLRFPYQDYVNVPVKKEPDLPELGISANLSLEVDVNRSSSLKNCQDEVLVAEDGTLYDPEEIKQALALNNKIQQMIVSALSKITEKIDENKSRQAEIKKILDAQAHSKTMNKNYKSIQLFAAPYFRDIKGMMPPENEDTIAKERTKDITAYNRPPRPWSLFEKDKLTEAVGANALLKILQTNIERRDNLKNKMKDGNTTDEDMAICKRDIIMIERQMRLQCERPLQDLVEEVKVTDKKLDWMTISATGMEGIRSDLECALLWNNYLSPSINKNHFTPKEDQQIKALVLKYNCRNWKAIADELETKRSAIMVFERYQTKLNKELCNKFWTPEEDTTLLDLIEGHKVGNYINWNAICNKMEGRSRYQLVNRYERTLSNINRSPWSPEEDAMLYACVYKFKNGWVKMQEFFTRRSVYNIRERFVNTLNPELRLGGWTSAEDMELIKLIKLHGYGKWSRISRFLPGRTDNMCYCRTRRLVIHSVRDADDVDVNWESSDLTRLVEKLKPASSSLCRSQNSRLRRTQNRAREMLEAALKKIAPIIEESINLETLNCSNLSLSSMRLLCKELGSLTPSTTEAIAFKPKYYPLKSAKSGVRKFTSNLNYLNSCKAPPKRKRDTWIDDSDDDSEAEVDDFKLSEVESVWLAKIMEKEFNDEAKCLYSLLNKKKHVNFTRKDNLEIVQYTEFLKEYLGCKDNMKKESEHKDHINSLRTVTNVFIQPHSSNKDLIVMAPNFSTLFMMDTVLSAEDKLTRSACLVGHSRDYVEYLLGFSDRKPKCALCASREDGRTDRNFEEVVKDMKKNGFVVDDRLREEALLESKTVPEDQPQVCRCGELERSKSDVLLFAKRFISMALWPYLIEQAGMSKKQEELTFKLKPRASKIPTEPPPTEPQPSEPIPSESSPEQAREPDIPEEQMPKRKPVKKRTVCQNRRKAPPAKTRVQPKKEKTSTPAKARPSKPVLPTRRSQRACVRNRSFAHLDLSDEISDDSEYKCEAQTDSE